MLALQRLVGCLFSINEENSHCVLWWSLVSVRKQSNLSTVISFRLLKINKWGSTLLWVESSDKYIKFEACVFLDFWTMFKCEVTAVCQGQFIVKNKTKSKLLSYLLSIWIVLVWDAQFERFQLQRCLPSLTCMSPSYWIKQANIYKV